MGCVLKNMQTRYVRVQVNITSLRASGEHASGGGLFMCYIFIYLFIYLLYIYIYIYYYYYYIYLYMYVKEGESIYIFIVCCTYEILVALKRAD